MLLCRGPLLPPVAPHCGPADPQAATFEFFSRPTCGEHKLALHSTRELLPSALTMCSLWPTHMQQFVLLLHVPRTAGTAQLALHATSSRPPGHPHPYMRLSCCWSFVCSAQNTRQRGCVSTGVNGFALMVQMQCIMENCLVDVQYSNANEVGRKKVCGRCMDGQKKYACPGSHVGEVGFPGRWAPAYSCPLSLATSCSARGVRRPRA